MSYSDEQVSFTARQVSELLERDGYVQNVLSYLDKDELNRLIDLASFELVDRNWKTTQLEKDCSHWQETYTYGDGSSCL